MVVGASAGAGGGRGLTHAALAVRCALEAGVAGALEGTDDVDALAVGTQAVTQGAFINVCRGSTWLVGTAGRGGAPGRPGLCSAAICKTPRHWDTCALRYIHDPGIHTPPQV